MSEPVIACGSQRLRLSTAGLMRVNSLKQEACAGRNGTTRETSLLSPRTPWKWRVVHTNNTQGESTHQGSDAGRVDYNRCRWRQLYAVSAGCSSKWRQLRGSIAVECGALETWVMDLLPLRRPVRCHSPLLFFSSLCPGINRRCGGRLEG